MKHLPIFIIVGFILLLSLGGFIVFNLVSREKTSDSVQEQVIKELPLEGRPFVSLTPAKSGQELTLSVTKIPSGVSTLEYELVYNTASDIVQGVPGSVAVEGKEEITRNLTLGTCSSGVCRYDKGVKDTTLTIRLRDAKGKLVSKLSTGVELLTKERELPSTDGKFKLTLDKVPLGYFIVMQTSGLPGKISGNLIDGPYGVFTSGDPKQAGKVSLGDGKILVWSGETWEELINGATKTLGVFVLTNP